MLQWTKLGLVLFAAAVTMCPRGGSGSEDASGKQRDKSGEPARGERRFRPVRVVPPFDPITDARTLPAALVKDEVTDGELVIGVVAGGEARAYPINMLTGPRREIINDELGGHAIAATW